MKTKATAILVAISLICLASVAGGALTPYTQDFELLLQTSPTALSEDGWLVFGNVSDPFGGYLYGYGPFAAPNDGFAFCQIDLLQGGPEQGLQQLVVFSDYNNADHADSNFVESNTFQEQIVGAADVGDRWTFAFDAKLGNLEGVSTAAAFIKTLDPGAGFALTNFISLDMTSIPETWTNFSISIDIDATLEDQILQFGFLNVATKYQGSGVFYDNIVFNLDTSSVPGGSVAAGAELRQNFPNPFNPETRIDFDLERSGPVDLTVYDVAGRRIVTLQSGELPSGPHHVTWNGRDARGAAAPSGQYRYVLTTADGRVSRSMMLLK